MNGTWLNGGVHLSISWSHKAGNFLRRGAVVRQWVGGGASDAPPPTPSPATSPRSTRTGAANIVTSPNASGGATVTAGAALFVAGLAAAVGLAIRVPWRRPAVIAVGALNLIGGVVAVATDSEGAVIGIAVSVLILVFSFLATDRNEARLSASPRSLG